MGQHVGDVLDLTGIGAEPGQREHAVEHPAHRARLLDRLAEILGDLGGHGVRQAAAQVVQREAQAGERGAQLVAGVGDELLLPVQGALQDVGHPVERGGEPAQLGRAALEPHPGRHLARRDARGGLVEPGDRAQQPARERPGGTGEQGGQRRGHAEQQQPAQQDVVAQRPDRRGRHHRTDRLGPDPDRDGDHQVALTGGPDRAGWVGLDAAFGQVDGLLQGDVRWGRPGLGGEQRAAVAAEHPGVDAVDGLVAGQFRLEGVEPAAAERPVGHGGEPLGVGEPVEVHALGGPVGDHPGERNGDHDGEDDQEGDQQPQQTAQHGQPVLASRYPTPRSVSIRTAAPASLVRSAATCTSSVREGVS